MNFKLLMQYVLILDLEAARAKIEYDQDDYKSNMVEIDEIEANEIKSSKGYKSKFPGIVSGLDDGWYTKTAKNIPTPTAITVPITEHRYPAGEVVNFPVLKSVPSSMTKISGTISVAGDETNMELGTKSLVTMGSGTPAWRRISVTSGHIPPPAFFCPSKPTSLPSWVAESEGSHWIPELRSTVRQGWLVIGLSALSVGGAALGCWGLFACRSLLRKREARFKRSREEFEARVDEAFRGNVGEQGSGIGGLGDGWGAAEEERGEVFSGEDPAAKDTAVLILNEGRQATG